MQNPENNFPAYRKYPNEKIFFKIISPVEFEEVQLIGKSGFIHHFLAKIHPDRILISDMLNCLLGHWVKSTPEEYRKARKIATG